jgi:hypothetical protein
MIKTHSNAPTTVSSPRRPPRGSCWATSTPKVQQYPQHYWQFEQKYETKKLTTKELNDLKLKQEQEQDDVLDELIHNVKTLKGGGKAIH